MKKYLESNFIKLISEKEVINLEENYFELVNLIYEESIKPNEDNIFYQRLIILRGELEMQKFINGGNYTDEQEVIILYINKMIYIINSHINLMRWEILGQKVEKKLKRNMDKIDKIRWTGKIVDLVELTYALYEAEVINEGNTDIKVILRFFSELFSVNLKNYQNLFRTIRGRVGNDRTYFLNSLIEKLNKRMDLADSGNYNYQKEKNR